MFKGQKSLRTISIASLLVAVTAITATASWTDYLNPIAYFESTNGSQVSEPVSSVGSLMVVNTCDVASAGNPIEVESTLPSGPTAYANLAAAFAAINAGTHQGAISVEVCFNSTETAATVLNSSGAGSANYTSISIRPLADGLTISGPTATGRGLIELNGADNVTIDGDNPNTAGTNRNLTIQNTATNTVTYAQVIRIALATTVITSADNVTIKNLNLLGHATGRNISTATNSSASENVSYGIYVSGGASTVSQTTAPSAISSTSTTIGSGATASNLTIQNNFINTAARGIAVQGSATTVFPGLLIESNTVGNATASATDQVYSMGITAQGSTNAILRSNTVYVESYVGASVRGIDFGGISATGSGTTFERNRVGRVYSRNTSGFGSYGINIVSGNNNIVRNNFVYDVNAFLTNSGISTTFGSHGIRITTGTGHQVLHNSVNLFGAVLGSTTISMSSALTLVSTASTGMDVRNNILVNTQTGAVAGTPVDCIYLPSGATSAMNLTVNNNDYYSNSQLGQQGATSISGFTIAAFDPSTTAGATNWRNYTSTLSAAGTNDNASKKVDPVFVSSTDLHIQSSSTMESAGANAGVTDDIDGDSRGATPDIGADEISLAGPGTVQFSATSYTQPEGNTATITVNRTGGSSGAISVDYATSDSGGSVGGASCTAGVDYISASGTLNWADTDTAAKTFNVTLCTDTDSPETGEAVSLTLSNAVGTSITGTNPVPLNITDNPPGTVQFSSTTYASDEGLTAVITATRTGGTGGAVSVNYATSDGSATAGTCGSGGDYVAASGTLNWTNGESTSKTFNVTLCTDLLTSEGAETVNLTLSSPTGGATIGANNPAVLTINDTGITFCNSDGAITIPTTTGTGPFPSTPYPSVVNVTGLVGTTNTVKVKLYGYSHTFPDDVDVLLVSPTGQKFVLMSDVGSGTDAVNANLVFDDAAATAMGDSTAVVSGTFRPADYDAVDTWATGVPAGPYSSPASVGSATLNGTFGGANPNGNWSLYVSDDASGDGGSIASWCLEFTVNPPSPGTVQFGSATYSGNENTNVSVSVARTGGTAGAVTVDYQSSDVSATAGTCGSGGDYVATGLQTLSWADGEGGSKTFNVSLCPDASSEPAETFNITLTNATGGATIGAINPTVVTINDVPPPLSGTYTVGSGGNYSSLTNNGGIFQALNGSGASGNIVINITSDVSGELGTHALNELSGGYSVTIQPSGGPWTITGSSTGSLIALNGADNVLIDGSGTNANAAAIVGGDASLRKLTITNTNTGTSSAVISLRAGTNGATGNTVKNVNVVGSSSTAGTLVGIEISGNTVGSLGADNDNNSIVNCSVQKSYYGITALGTSAANPNQQNYINRNDLSATGANSIGLIGVYALNVNNLQVQENSVGGISNAISADTIGLAIGTQSVSSSNSTGGGITNASVARNKVNGIANTATYSAAGITVAGAAGGDNVLTNNMVSGVISNGTSPDIPVGIFVAGATGSSTKLFHNSVSMTGDRGATTTQMPSYALAVTGLASTVESKNNIFYNLQSPGSGGTNAKSYAMGIADTTPHNIDSNYNDFYAFNNATAVVRTNSLDAGSGSDLAVGPWAFFDDDNGSYNLDPNFINSANDLHLNPLTSALVGSSFSTSAATDFDMDPRPASFGEMGADEVVNSDTYTAGGTFYNVRLDGTNLAANITVTNRLSLFGGPTPTDGFTVTLGCDAIVTGAGPSTYIDGAVRKDFCATGAFEFPVGQNQYSKVGVTVTALGTNPSSLTITPYDATLGGFNPLTSLSRNWNLEETGDLTADLLFYYDESDVNGNESDYSVYKRAGNGVVTNMCSGGPCVDTVNNILGPITGVSDFSRWTGSGPLAPTAADVSLSGRVTTADGRGIKNAVVVLTGNSLAQPVMARTGAFGYYRFDNLEAGEVYVVTINSKRFIFPVPSRVVSVPDSVSNVDFVAMPEE